MHSVFQYSIFVANMFVESVRSRIVYSTSCRNKNWRIYIEDGCYDYKINVYSLSKFSNFLKFELEKKIIIIRYTLICIVFVTTYMTTYSSQLQWFYWLLTGIAIVGGGGHDIFRFHTGTATDVNFIVNFL